MVCKDAKMLNLECYALTTNNRLVIAEIEPAKHIFCVNDSLKELEGFKILKVKSTFNA